VPRVTVAYVSDFQRDRVHRSDFYRGESRRYRAEFRGVLPEGVYVQSSKWQCLNPSVTIMSAITGDYTGTEITLTLGYAGIGAMTCTVVLTNGAVVNQQFVVGCNPSPWYTGEVVQPQGPYQLTFVNPTPIVTVTGDLGNGQAGDVVSVQYQATGGTPPYFFSVASGAIPAGLSMSSQGRISGTRTTTGDYTFTVSATDNKGALGYLPDESSTYNVPPVYTGTFQSLAWMGGSNEFVLTVVPNGQWHFLWSDFDLTTGIIKSYVDNVLKGTHTSTSASKPVADIVVSGQADDPNVGNFRGLLWGAGIYNGTSSQSDRDALWNGGSGKSFAKLAMDNPSTYANLAYAWQLNDADGSPVLVESHGRTGLTLEPSNAARSAFSEPKFGVVSRFNHAGRARAVGTASGGADNSTKFSYFCWVYANVISTDSFPSIICRYTGFVEFLGMRTSWNSN